MAHKSYVKRISQSMSQNAIFPIRGSIDLTYRCNNNCRHCWLWLPEDSFQKTKELSTEDIKNIVLKGKASGCGHWSISGGEPLIRSDFQEILEFIINTNHSFSLNTNGSLITPKIAGFLKARGTKMVSMYGPNPDVHDNITRTIGSFESFIQGCSYLKEAGAGFIVQLVFLKSNQHVRNEMVALAEQLSPHQRIGLSWLYLSPNIIRNKEIIQERLSPAEMVRICGYDFGKEFDESKEKNTLKIQQKSIFADCISKQNDFHVDPYGKMSFCNYIKDESLRYNICKGDFPDYWNVFLPQSASNYPITKEYEENCRYCEKRSVCSWCPAFGYLEHGNFSAKIEYLCQMAEERIKLKKKLNQNDF